MRTYPIIIPQNVDKFKYLFIKKSVSGYSDFLSCGGGGFWYPPDRQNADDPRRPAADMKTGSRAALWVLDYARDEDTCVDFTPT